MSKAIFWGDNYYTWLGIKDILRGTKIYVGMQYHSTCSLPDFSAAPENNDYLIINADQANVLHYASIIRDLSSRLTFTLFVLTDVETFTVFQTVCGLQMHLLDQTQSLDALYQRVMQLIDNPRTSPNHPLTHAITRNEFNVMMMLSRGWSLSKIANIAHKKRKNNRYLQKQYC